MNVIVTVLIPSQNYTSFALHSVFLIELIPLEIQNSIAIPEILIR